MPCTARQAALDGQRTPTRETPTHSKPCTSHSATPGQRKASGHDNVSQDIEAQLTVIPLQISSVFLDPLVQAFGRLAGTGLDRQLESFAGNVAQMAGIFKQISDGLDQLAATENADVKSRLSEVRVRLQSFRERLVTETVRIADEIVTQVSSAKIPSSSCWTSRPPAATIDKDNHRYFRGMPWL
jgi:hypothetical protein